MHSYQYIITYYRYSCTPCSPPQGHSMKNFAIHSDSHIWMKYTAKSIVRKRSTFTYLH